MCFANIERLMILDKFYIFLLMRVANSANFLSLFQSKHNYSEIFCRGRHWRRVKIGVNVLSPLRCRGIPQNIRLSKIGSKIRYIQ